MDTTSGTRRSIHRRTRASLTVALVGLGALGLAACGGSNNQSASSYGSAAPPSAQHAARNALASATNATLGQTILVDASGRTVYLFVPDGSSTRSTVPAAIKANWPAVASTTAVRAGSGVQANAISVLTQADGTRQVAYAGHLLYTFVGDQRTGDTNGQGFAGNWYVVSPNGTPIGRGTALTTTSTTQAPHRANDGDADDKGGPSDDDGNK